MKTAIRTSNIEIDTTVPDSVQWINANIQYLDVSDDGSIKSISGRMGQLHRRVDLVAAQGTTIVDPVTGMNITISAAGVATAIKQFMINWMLEDNPDFYLDIEKGLVIKK